ncbi:MAG: DUF2029 domain-containing protein [Ruminococcaceae bacterium]|nr:DUF2029 domain-containing protein [Oscillospiraceae bacterium]
MKKKSRYNSVLKNTNDRNINLFIAVFFVCALFYILVKILFTNFITGVIETDYTDIFFVSSTDHFMDFFNPLYFSSFENPYEFKDLGAIYPPICYILYKIVLLFVPAGEITDRFEIRENRTVVMLFAMITMALLLATVAIIFQNLRTSHIKKWILSFCIIFSFPMLFLIERGNILLLCLALSLFFVFYHDSKNKLMSELSLIALAIAAAIKIYPAVFGILLFFEKRIDIKKIARCILYGIAAFVLPFFLLDGLNTYKIFFANLISGVEVTKLSMYAVITRIDTDTFFYLVHSLVYGESVPFDSGVFPVIAKVFKVIFIVASGAIIAFAKEDWKKALGIVNLTLLLPAFSYTYVCVFVLIPLILAFNEKAATDKCGKIYLSLMTLIMIPVPLLPNNVKVLFALVTLYSVVTVEAVTIIITKVKTKHRKA